MPQPGGCRLLCSAVLFLLGCASALSAASANVALLPWHQSHQILASDGSANDRFGTAVALAGDRAFAGAPEHDVQGSDAGAAYLFDTILGSQTYKLLANDLAPFDQYAGDEFGFGVAVTGNRALVSAPFDDEYGADAGAVYAFDLHPVTGAPTQTQKFVATDITGGEQLGYSLAISGDTAVVGALTAVGFGGAVGVGAAYVYQHDGYLWQFDKKLTIDDPISLQDGDKFGWSVDLDGTTAIVGGRDGALNLGTAYLFDTSTGQQLAKLSAADNGVTGLMDQSVRGQGSAVAIDGDYAVVGATETESAYVFENDGLGNWSLIQTLTGLDTVAGDKFGISLALEGTTAVVGASRHNNLVIDSGAAYVFDVLQGTQIDKLTQNNGSSFEKFGYSVAIGEDLILSGALEAFDDSPIATRTGSAFLFSEIQATDFEEDGDVDMQDLVKWQTGFGMPNPGHMDGDADFDGDVDGADFLTWQRQLETPSVASVVGQVPEPGTLCLWMLAAGLLALGRL